MMHRDRCRWLRWLCLAAGLAAAAPAIAGTPAERLRERDAFEKGVIAELGQRDAGAVPLLKKAEAARRDGRTAEAETLYRQLLDQVPGFVHAQRRLCDIVSTQGKHEEAIALCRAALEQRRSPENLSALAAALVSAGKVDEARFAAGEAARIDPESIAAHGALCAVALNKNDNPALHDCSAKLMHLAPDLPIGHFYAALAAGNDEDWDEAREHLERAHQLGLPDDLYKEIGDRIDDLEPLWPLVLELAGLAVGIWLGVMLLLVLAGSVLSRLTMRAASRVTGAGAGERLDTAGAGLRSTYRAVLTLSCLVYYASLPLLLAIIVLTAGGLIYAFWAAGYIPIKLDLIIGFAALVSAGAVLKSLFARGGDSAPGELLDLEEHPDLRALLDEVAATIETRPVDSVYLTPGTEIAVTERGGVFKQLRGTPERCLILGVGVLDDLPLAAFKAILAHEYGHFSNRDTAGGRFALAVRRSLLTMGISLAKSGSATPWNPAWLFFRVFYRAFQGISQGASRLQEIMADRWAVSSYGAASFETGLRHVIRRSIAFGRHLDASLEEAIEGGIPVHNIYRYTPEIEVAVEDAELDAAVEEEISREPSAYDSHPRAADRFRWARAIGAPEPEGDDGAETWSLFADREALEEQMTEEIRQRVLDRYGIDLANPEPDDDEEE